MCRYRQNKIAFNNMSFIPQLQTHLIGLKEKKDRLKVLEYSLSGFSSSEEAETIKTMISITNLQIAHGKKALMF